MSKRVVILGATGSIGESARKVARALPDAMRVVGMSANRNGKALVEAAHEFHPSAVCLADEEADPSWTQGLPGNCRALTGTDGLVELATLPEADMVLIAIVGTGGLRPALAAIRAGKDIAVASKEILVMAGEIVMAEAAKAGVRVLPVDSEHNAIFQCLEGRPSESVKRAILTCSGGPCRTLPTADLAKVRPCDALKHPTWSMGRKISIDSATLFNKGLEMIEARWLFDLPMERIDVIVHPQSIVHSIVEFVDGSQLAQMSCSDMGFPIQYAVTWPQRVAGALRTLDLASVAKLEFEEPRHADFPALRLARAAGTTGGTLPAVLNASNEVAVDAFLSEQISFPGIWETVEKVMDQHETINHPTLADLLEADKWARQVAAEAIAAP